MVRKKMEQPIRFRTSEGVKKLARKTGWKMFTLFALKLAKSVKTTKKEYSVVLTSAGVKMLRRETAISRLTEKYKRMRKKK